MTGEAEGLAPYLKAVRAAQPLSREEERNLAIRSREGDLRARHELVRRHLALVLAVVRKQYRGTVRLEELVQEGNLGLIRAAEKFDPDAGTRFSTYAVWWIRAFVWKHLKEARSAVRPRSGTVARSDFSLDGAIDDDGDVSHLDLVEDHRPSPHEAYAASESEHRLRGALEKVRKRLGELGWDIVQSRLQQDPPDTLEEIGQRWGVSRERVRQVEATTKRFLRGYLEPLQQQDEPREEAA